MHSTLFNMDEVVTRKDYLKKKELEKKKRQKKTKEPGKKAPVLLLICIALLAGYVLFQFSTYQKKYKFVEVVPTEIASLKDYDVFYTTTTYTYEPEILLNHTKSNNLNKETIDTAVGLINITGKNGYVYGIKADKLVRVKNGTDSIKKEVKAFNELEVIVDKNVKGYYIYKDEIYVYLNGEGNSAGVYTISKTDGKLVKLIDSEVSQIVVDEKNIFLVPVAGVKDIYSYTKDGKNMLQITKGRDVSYMIENETEIYFTDSKLGNKIFGTNKYTGAEKAITSEGAINISNGKNNFSGNFCMGVYDGDIYYINTAKANKLYKSKLDGSLSETAVINSNIEKISMIGASVIYKENGGTAIYRYELKSKTSTEITSGRIVDFSASVSTK